MAVSRCMAVIGFMLALVSGAQVRAEGMAGQFDYYVLALSWSPTFCQDERQATQNDDQCGLDKRYAFIVHGLWPQYAKADENGRNWPQDCPVNQPRNVMASVREQIFPIMPSNRLIEHQWDKHGTCSGLSQADYFRKVQDAYKVVTIPETYRQVTDIQTTNATKLENAFLGANPGLSEDGISLQCSKRRLQEVRICLSKDLKFIDCPAMRDRGCRGDLTLPAKR